MSGAGISTYVDDLKSKIRERVARRQAGGGNIGKQPEKIADLLRANERALESLLLDSLPPTQTERFLSRRIQPANGHYQIRDLLDCADNEQFIWNAYLVLLNREPDEDGFQKHLNALVSGHASKIDILARLRYSPEGRRNGVSVGGLLLRGIFSKGLRVLKRYASRDPQPQHHDG